MRSLTYLSLFSGVFLMMVAVLVRTGFKQARSRIDTVLIGGGLLLIVASLVMAVSDPANWTAR